MLEKATAIGGGSPTQFSGSIPWEEVGGLNNLEILFLGRNNFNKTPVATGYGTWLDSRSCLGAFIFDRKHPHMARRAYAIKVFGFRREQVDRYDTAIIGQSYGTHGDWATQATHWGAEPSLPLATYTNSWVYQQFDAEEQTSTRYRLRRWMMKTRTTMEIFQNYCHTFHKHVNQLDFNIYPTATTIPLLKLCHTSFVWTAETSRTRKAWRRED